MFTVMTTDTRRRGQGVKKAVAGQQSTDGDPSPTSGTTSRTARYLACFGRFDPLAAEGGAPEIVSGGGTGTRGLFQVI